MIELRNACARRVLAPIAMLVCVVGIASGEARAQAVCVGDCNSGGTVAINELVLGVNIALGSREVSACEAFDCDDTGKVGINCLVQGVNNALKGCGRATPTGTPAGTSAATATPTGELSVTPTPTGGTGSALTRVRLTYLQVKYDSSKPAILNNSVPIKFGITSNSADQSNPGKASVVVLFSFVEAAPVPPATPRSCDSNGTVLELVGNGVEQQFEADIFPTSDCASWVGEGGAMANLRVDFDAGLRESGMPTGIDYPPVVFSTANANAADNQLCRKTLDPNAPDPGRGCAYALTLQPVPNGTDGKPLVNVQVVRMKPESSVAILVPTAEDPDVPMGMHESDEPAVLVNAAFMLQGRDPYKNLIDPDGDGMVEESDLPPELVAADPGIVERLKFGLTDMELGALDDLPGTAAVKYDIVPTRLLGPDAWLPLAIDDPKNPDPDGHVQEIELTELDPGTETSVAHALYIDGEAREKVSPGGEWAADTDFTIRGCIVASFEEAENTGEEEDPDDIPEGGDVPMGDCRTFKVMLMRPAAPSAEATTAQATAVQMHSFNMDWTRAVGDAQKAQLSGGLRTNNTLDLNGAKSETEGVLEIKGYFNVKLFRAFAKASALTALATSGYEFGIEAFNISLFGRQMMGAELAYEMPFTMGPTFSFPVFSIGFGPVSIGITAGVGGEVGITPKISLSAKQGPPAAPGTGEPPITGLENATSNGLLKATIEPSAALTGNVMGGINLVVAKAALTAMLQVLKIGFPVTAGLRWGVTEQDMQMMVRKLTITGGLSWDLTLNWLNFTLDAMGSLGPCPFCLSKTINILKYENPEQKFNLLMRSLEAPIVLVAEGGGMPTPTGGAEGTPTATGGTEMSPTPTVGGEASPTVGGEATPTVGGEATPEPTTEEVPAGVQHLASPTPTATPIPVGA